MVKTVLIVWHDAHADRTRWTDIGEISDDGPYEVHTVGFLLPKCKKGHVTVAQSNADGIVDSLLHIPAKMVVRVTELGLKNESPAAHSPNNCPLSPSSNSARI